MLPRPPRASLSLSLSLSFAGGRACVRTSLHLPKNARAYLFPNLSKLITCAAAQLVLTPFVRDQAPMRRPRPMSPRAPFSRRRVCARPCTADIMMCVYIYIYICIYLFISICICVCIFMCICMCMYVYIYIYIYNIGGRAHVPVQPVRHQHIRSPGRLLRGLLTKP